MKHLLIQATLLLITINAFGQEVKFEVEQLSKPEALLMNRDYNDLYKWLILSDVNMEPFQVEKDGIDFPFHIIAKSEAPDSLVFFGYRKSVV